MLQLALLFLGFGNLLCGFAKTPIQLYCFRAISGLGGGGINGIAMTVVSMKVLRVKPSAVLNISRHTIGL
jgi:MFS family permease